MVKQCCSAMEGKGQTTKSWSYQCEFKSNCDTLKGTSININSENNERVFMVMSPIISSDYVWNWNLWKPFTNDQFINSHKNWQNV